MPTFDHVSEIDWARLAVLIDGEGSIGIQRNVRHSKAGFGMRVVVEVANTDPRMMKWLHDVFGGTVRCKDFGKHRRHVCFKWQSAGTFSHVILTKCLPYFLIKRDQAETAIAFRETVTFNKGRAGKDAETNTIQEMLHKKLKAQKTEHLLPIETLDSVSNAYDVINSETTN